MARSSSHHFGSGPGEAEGPPPPREAKGPRFTSAFYVTLAALGFILVLAGWGVWVAFAEGGAPIGLHGWIAMGLAIVISGLVGGGLMWLAFYSAKKGVDDDVSRFD